jgi:hypothetical protein
MLHTSAAAKLRNVLSRAHVCVFACYRFDHLDGTQLVGNDNGSGQTDSLRQQPPDTGADTVHEELIKMQVLRITSTGRIFRWDCCLWLFVPKQHQASA